MEMQSDPLDKYMLFALPSDDKILFLQGFLIFQWDGKFYDTS